MIPLAEPNLGHKAREYVERALLSGWVSGGGEYVDRFEEMVAKACGRKWAVATITGTAALHAALSLYDLSGKRVKMPSFTFIAAANVLHQLGATPWFYEKTNQPLDWSRIGPIVDAAPAVGLGRDIPGNGHMVCLSFNGNKTITTGQGGAVVGDDPDQEHEVRHIISVAKSGVYEFDRPGFNYRMPNLNAALGCAQMERLDEFRAKKRAIMERYTDAGLSLLSSSWMAVWVTSSRMTKIMHLRAMGIDARPFWKPVHLQEPYKDCPKEDLAATEEIWERLICLPCSTHLTVEDQDRVIDVCLSLSRGERTEHPYPDSSVDYRTAGHLI